MVIPWCTPVSQVISSPGVQSTESAALTAAGRARCLCAEVRCWQRSAGADDGKGGEVKLKMFKGGF